MPAVEPPSVDLNALGEVRATLGVERTSRLLQLLAVELEKRFEPGSCDLEDLALDAHTITSAAGMLGFKSLSKLCRKVEQACRAGREVKVLRARLMEARRAAINQIAVLRAA